MASSIPCRAQLMVSQRCSSCMGMATVTPKSTPSTPMLNTVLLLATRWTRTSTVATSKVHRAERRGTTPMEPSPTTSLHHR